MDDRRAADQAARVPVAAWALAGPGLALAVGSVVLAGLNGVSVVELVAAHDAVGIASGFASALVGLLIVRQDRGNRLGWVLLVAAATVGVYDFSRQYAVLVPSSSPGWELATWLALWTNVPPILLGTGLQFLLFPDGRAPSRRWRPVVWATAALTLALSVRQATLAWSLRADPGVIQNGDEGLDTAFLIVFLVAMVLFVTSVVSLIARYRQAGAVRRQQIKWVMWGQIVAVPLQVSAIFGMIGAVLELLTVPITFGTIAIAILRPGCSTSTGWSAAPWSMDC